MEIFNLKGKTAVVIGGSGGIGRTLCFGLAKAGVKICPVSRSKGPLEEVANEAKKLGTKVFPYVADATSYKEIEIMKEKILDQFGRIDILINSQGLNIKKPALELEKEARKDDESGDNVQIYRTAMNSFKRFRKKLSTSQVTVEFLKQYETNMTKADKSVAYISINQRTLKAVWNWAKREGHIKTDVNPFANYTIKKSSKKNVALNENELRTLRNYEPQTDAERRAFHFWWFLFYCNGINIKDACLLKHKNISGETVEIRRAKTRRTNQSVVVVRFKYSEKIEAIINELGNKDESTDAFVFNILQHGLNYKDTRRLVQNHTDVVNKYMKIIGQKLGILKKIKTNVARHSFATYLYRRGTQIGIISEALGHSSIQTTKLYLASFDEETLQKTADLLDEI